MANPSTIWAQLSMPNPPVGSLPYVATDGQTIITDVANLQYLDLADSGVTGYQLPYQLTVTNGLRANAQDFTASPAISVSTLYTRGSLAIPAGQTAIVVINPTCFLSSLIFLQLESLDTTLTRIIPSTIAAGTFTVTGNAAATAITKFSFIIENVR